MKKFRTILVTALAMLMVLFCFASCGKTGKYVATTLKAGSNSTELTDNASYIELKSDDVAVMSINIQLNLIFTQIDETIEGTGTWTEGEDGAIVITINSIEYNAVVDGKTMTLDLAVCEIVLEKE